MADADGARMMRALGDRLRALAAAGDIGAAPQLGAGRTLRAQLLAAIRVASKPAIQATKEAARTQLPKGGGLNEYVAKQRITASTRLTGAQAGVRIKAQSKLWTENQTAVRHPPFGHRNRKWTDTKMANPGWFTETLQHQAPAVTAAIRTAMRDVADEAMRRQF